MTDQIETDIARAKRAALLIDDDLLRECFATLEASYIDAWRRATRDTDADAAYRERIWMALRVLDKVQSHLHAVINDGQMAQAQLEELKAERAAA